jgi:hypothetical protein
MESTDDAWGGIDGDKIDGFSDITEYIHGTLDATRVVEVNPTCKWDLMEARMWKLIKKADTEEMKALKVHQANAILNEQLRVVTQENVTLAEKVEELQDSITELTLDLMTASNEVHVLSEMLSNIRILADTTNDSKNDSLV